MKRNDSCEHTDAEVDALPDNPLDVPEPIGLLKGGYWAQTVTRWVTDTGVAVRARLPFLSKMAEQAPKPNQQLLSGTTQLALIGFLIVEIILLVEIQISP